MSPRPPLSIQGLYRRVPLTPERMTADLTAREDLFVLIHLGAPILDTAGWSLTVDGLVDRPLRLGWEDLKRFPIRRLRSVHECAGNPLQPTLPMRRVVNVEWGGVALTDLLAEAGVRPEATFLWSYGADHGDWQGTDCPHFLKDLPLSRLADDVLVATEVNGEPLPAENGFPARLVVPGHYGTNSTKWLYRLTLADRRADGVFTTAYYNDTVRDAAGRERVVPVWAIAPESLIVSPAPGQAVRVGEPVTIWGRAWGGGLSRVEVSSDGGASWQPAELAPQAAGPDRWSWRRFDFVWRPAAPGPVRLMSRAWHEDGTCQPMDGWRNAVHSVEVTVE